MKIYKNFTELIGKTPLLALENHKKKNNLEASILAKLEAFNPGGSAKDRIAYAMIDDAEKKGLLSRNGTVIEPTSGNTGIGLAAICAYKGIRAIFTMPETMSIERRNLLKAYGAEIVLTPANEGMSGAIKKAKELSLKIPGSFIPSQFENPANPEIHFLTTGPEIWEDTDGNIDFFVAGVGTGGTLSGVGKYLKSKNPNIKIIAVEPESSPVLSKGISGAHNIQGIGAGFIPKTLDTEVFDEIITVKNEDAIAFSKSIAKSDGILVGISSGASLFASTVIAKRPENKNKTVVTLFPDTGERYLSVPEFSN